MPEDPFLFVVGAGRSGTTLLRSMIDAHPDVAVPGESHFIATMIRLRRRYESGGSFHLERFLQDLGRHDRFQRWDDDVQPILEHVRAAAPEDLASAIRQTYRAYADIHGATRYVDKTPDYVTRMEPLADLLPEARFVHLIRDGRAVAASLLAQDWGPDDAVLAAQHWSARVRKGRAAGSRLGPDVVLEVRYEALVESPEATLRTICEFAELEFHPSMLDYRMAAQRALKQVAAPESHGALLAPVEPTVGQTHWDALDPSTQTVIECAAASELRTLGYADVDVNAMAAARSRIRHGVSLTRAIPRRLGALRRFVG